MQRLLLFVTCLALGCAVGFVGWHLSGSEWWFLAVPGVITAGWLAVANPEQCLPHRECPPGGDNHEA